MFDACKTPVIQIKQDEMYKTSTGADRQMVSRLLVRLVVWLKGYLKSASGDQSLKVRSWEAVAIWRPSGETSA